MSQPGQQHQLIDHLFRHESGKMIAVLTRIFGIQHLELAEDIVQDTMLKALSQWKFNNIPEKPSAWLYRAAKNKVIDELRRQRRFNEISGDLSYLLQSEYTLAPTVEHLFLEEEVKDSQLRMIFAACHPAIPAEAQIALTLKSLCGFSIPEIAKAFLTNEANINKRLYRAKEKIRNKQITLEIPSNKELAQRLESVLKTIYLLFNEGYNSNGYSDTLIRKDICYEAMRLALLLIQNPATNQPSTNACMALMCFQASRFDARTDGKQQIILLKDQDRSLWSEELIQLGSKYLNHSAAGNQITAYHLEAAIASLYCIASSWENTDWDHIYRLYNQLLQIKNHPIIILNRAIVSAQINGPEKAISEIVVLKELQDHYLYHATLGELYRLTGNQQNAQIHLKKAKLLTNSIPEKNLLEWKLQNLN